MPKGKCCNCLYAGPEPTLWIKGLTIAYPATLTCVNHPDGLGEMKQVMPSDTCRNFRPRRQPPVRLDAPPADQGLRRIAPTKGKFAPVDAARPRDQKAIELFGKYAWLNFPNEAGGQKTEDGRQRTSSAAAPGGVGRRSCRSGGPSSVATWEMRSMAGPLGCRCERRRSGRTRRRLLH
jgi:hypothetical protein